MYSVIFSKNALEDYGKLGKETQFRILQVLERARGNPRGRARKLFGAEDEYRLRVGDYRIILRIDDGNRQMLVTAIGHRKNIYNLV